ncbi:MAG TPA: hypothetical protein VGH07_09245 [Chthoniobacterales bacterium]
MANLFASCTEEAKRDASLTWRASVTARAHSRLSSALILLCSIFCCGSAQEIPAGFKLERYVQLWKRNPFVLVTPDAPHARPSPFDKLSLTSWLKVGATEVIFVQNSETNEAEKITAEPNQNNLRIVEFHLNPNPRLVEAVISNGKEQGIVKFKFDVQAPASQTASAGDPTANRGATTPQAHISRFYPGLPRLANGEGSSEGSRFYPRKTNPGGNTAFRPTETQPKHSVPGQTSESSSPDLN